MTHILVTQSYSHFVTACQGKTTLSFWLALDRRVTKWNEFEEVEDDNYDGWVWRHPLATTGIDTHGYVDMLWT